jgi:hypothetical protein
VARGTVIAARHDGPWICLGTIISDHDARPSRDVGCASPSAVVVVVVAVNIIVVSES